LRLNLKNTVNALRRVDDEVNGRHGRPTHPAFDEEFD
jgi:hypothetical protein